MVGPNLTDAGVGRALFTTRFRLSLQAGWMCLWFGAIPALLLTYAVWFWQATRGEVDVVRLDILSHVYPADSVHRWRMRDPAGMRRVIVAQLADGSIREWFTGSQLRLLLESELAAVVEFRLVCYGSLLAALAGFVVVWLLLRRLGAGSQQNQRVRGAADVLSARELDRRVRARGGGAYRLVDVALPKAGPTTGIMLLGAQGTGKSLAIHDLMQQAFRKGRKCIIYDQNGEFMRAYFRPGKDVFFNPACLGSVAWSLFRELRYAYDADALAQAFLPPKAGVVSGPGAFFEDAARALFSVILLRLTAAGAQDTRDIARAFLEMPDQEIDFLIRNSVASSAVGGDSKQQRQGVISSIAIYLNGISAVQPGDWSLRDFIDGPEDRRFFILGTEDTKAMFAPLFRLLLAVGFGLIAAKQEIVQSDRYWFFLDEVHTLGDIKLDEWLATLRKFGVCIVTGIQSESQLVSSLGEKRAETVANCFNTALILRANEPTMQERAARRLGKVEMDTVSRNQALAVAEWRDGAALNKTEHEKWLVMPSEVGLLDNCTGWLKLVGSYPAAKVDYRSWLKGSWLGGARVDAFKPGHEIPPRDPGFLVVRRTTQDAFASVREDTAAALAQQAPPAVPAASPTPKTSRTRKHADLSVRRTATGDPALGSAAAQAAGKVADSEGSGRAVFTSQQSLDLVVAGDAVASADFEELEESNRLAPSGNQLLDAGDSRDAGMRLERDR